MPEEFIHADGPPVTEEQVQQAKQEAALLAARATLLEANPIETRRQCTATNRAGTRCGRAPIPGGFVCDRHGGKAPQTVAAAQARLRSLWEPLFEILTELVDTWHGTRCDKCGRPTGDVSEIVSVVKTVFDRSGLGPSARLTVAAEASAADDQPYVDWLTDDELRTIGDIFEAAQRRMEDGEPMAARSVNGSIHGARIVGMSHDTGPVIDAEVVGGGE